MVGSGLFLGLAPQVFRQKLIKPEAGDSR